MTLQNDSKMSDTVTITISRLLAHELATYWTPIDDDDTLIELFDACRAALEGEK